MERYLHKFMAIISLNKLETKKQKNIGLAVLMALGLYYSYNMISPDPKANVDQKYVYDPNDTSNSDQELM